MRIKSIFLLLLGLLVFGIIGCALKNKGPSPITRSSPETVGESQQDEFIPQTSMEPMEPEPPEIKPKATVTAYRLNLRAGPSIENRILGVLNQGQTVDVLSTENAWIQVQTRSHDTGWVHGRYISHIDRNAIPAAKDSQSTGIVTVQTGKKLPAESKKTRIRILTKRPSKAVFVKLYERYRHAIIREDLESIVSLTYTTDASSATPNPEQLAEMREQFAKVKDFLTVIYPDLSTSKILKFHQNNQAAMLILQTELDDREYLHLNAITFFKTGTEWKIVSKVEGNTLLKKGGDRDKKAIAKDLNENPMFQLSRQAKGVAHKKPGGGKLIRPKMVPSQVGQAKGQLVVNGKSTDIRYGYAMVQPSRFRKGEKGILVILSNMPLSDKAVMDWSERTKLERIGKLHGMELTINSDMEMTSTKIYHPAFKASPTGLSVHELFEPKKGEKDIIQGKVYCKKPLAFFNITYQYGAAFKAVIRKEKEFPQPEDTEIKQDNPIFNTPVNRAIEKMLLASGAYEILKTASGISSNTFGDFAKATISYRKGENNTDAKVYLFKEAGQWVAYRNLPTHKDHPMIFMELAAEYCKAELKHFQGIGYCNGDRRGRNPEIRMICYNCIENVNNRYHDIKVRLLFEYDDRKGWRVAKEMTEKEALPGSEKIAAVKTSKVKHKNKPKKALLQTKVMEYSDHVVDRFFLSIIEGDISAVAEFLNTGVSPNVKRPRSGHSPLYTAAFSHHHDIGLMLIKAGANPNFKDENGSTALIWAARDCGSAELVQALINAGANVNTRAKGGATPSMMALVSNCGKIQKILKKAGAK